MSKIWHAGWCINHGERRFHGYLVATCLLIALYSPSSLATEYQNLDTIKKTVIEGIKASIDSTQLERYEIDVQKLDGRLRLAACHSAMTTKLSKPFQIIGRQSVEVRCTGSKPWKIYLQVAIFAKTDVPVLKHSVASGTRISQADIEMKTINLGADNRPIVESLQQLVGKKAKRHLRPGVPILVSQVQAPNVIQRGQKVSLEYNHHGLVVRMSGKSNQDAAEGDWVKVVNLSSGKTVEGRVNASGNVSVPN